jgi:hypothetical protein
MFLQKLNGLLHWLNGFKSSVLDLLNITEMCHDLHQQLFVLRWVGTFRQLPDSLINVFDKVVDVLNLLDGIVK